MVIIITYSTNQVKLYLCQVLCLAQNKTNKHNTNRIEPDVVLIQQSKSDLKIPRFGQMFSRREVMVLGHQSIQLVLWSPTWGHAWHLFSKRVNEQKKPSITWALTLCHRSWCVQRSIRINELSLEVLGRKELELWKGSLQDDLVLTQVQCIQPCHCEKLDYHIFVGKLKFG